MKLHNEIHYWQLQDAKARLSELVKLASQNGPQGISVRGQEAVVVISSSTYAKLTGVGENMNLFDFLQQSPLYGIELDIKRDQSPDRDLDL